MSTDTTDQPTAVPADGEPPRRSRTLWYVLGAVALVAVLAVAAVVWFLGGDAPDEVSIDQAASQVGAGAEGGEGEGDTSGDAVAADANGGGEIDGEWVVDTSVGEFAIDDSTGTFVGARIDEVLSNIGETVAVIRTPEVDGSLTIDDLTLTEAEVVADFTALVSDEPRREDAVQGTLETGEYPEATFELTEPVELPAAPAPGEPVSVTAVGDLTVAGETDEVEVPLDVALSDGTAVVTGSFDVALSDYGVEAPSAPIVVSVEDTATVELQLFMSPA